MATSFLVTLNDTTPTLVFHGQGTVIVRNVSGAPLLGGADVSSADGMPFADRLPFRVESEDKIYGIASSGTGSAVVAIFSCR